MHVSFKISVEKVYRDNSFINSVNYMFYVIKLDRFHIILVLLRKNNLKVKVHLVKINICLSFRNIEHFSIIETIVFVCIGDL